MNAIGILMTSTDPRLLHLLGTHPEWRGAIISS